MRPDPTPLLRAYARLRRARLARLDPVRAQERTLLRLVRTAAGTRFGRDHGFAGIESVAEFQARVPLRAYAAYWDDYLAPAFPVLENVAWPGRIPYLAATSGTTTGRTRYVPVSRAMIGSDSRAATDMLCHHLAARPASRLLAGRSFMLGGAVAMEERAPGVRIGDLSGILQAEAPRWSRPFVFPPLAEALESDWEKKIERLARLSLAEDIRTVAGTPSWLLLFLERLAAFTGKTRVRDVYPHLDLMVYGGMSFAPYHEVFAEWFEGAHADWREVYVASEGFVASADRGVGEGMRMNLDHGLFFEFLPVEELDSARPTRLWLGDVEPHREYELVLSTCAGLWAYRLGDVVRLVERDPPRLVVTGRTAYFLSAFGEHLSGEEIEEGVLAAADAIGRRVAEFSVGPLYPHGKRRKGRHLFLVELDGPALSDEEQANFSETLDRTLAATNEDYDVHRRRDVQLLPPECRFLAPGTFREWMRRRGKLGGQNKVPRVILDSDLLADLASLAQERAV